MPLRRAFQQDACQEDGGTQPYILPLPPPRAEQGSVPGTPACPLKQGEKREWPPKVLVDKPVFLC